MPAPHGWEWILLGLAALAVVLVVDQVVALLPARLRTVLRYLAAAVAYLAALAVAVAAGVVLLWVFASLIT